MYLFLEKEVIQTSTVEEPVFVRQRPTISHQTNGKNTWYLFTLKIYDNLSFKIMKDYLLLVTSPHRDHHSDQLCLKQLKVVLLMESKDYFLFDEAVF